MGISEMFNKVSDVFRSNKIRQPEAATQRNAIGKTQEELDFYSRYGLNSTNDIFSSNISFYDWFNTKRERISFYKTMSIFPEINDALDNICDDAVIDNGDGLMVYMDINKDRIPPEIEKQIKKEFEYVVNNVLSFHNNGWEYFHRWLVEAELYLEIVLNESKTKVIGVKVLPAHSIVPLYEGNIIKGYVQTKSEISTADFSIDNKESIRFEPNQISYINFGSFGRNMLDVRGYLEPVIRPYNMIRQIEDSIVIYRLVRSPERRVFNIDTGKLPKGKAEEYIKGIIQKYKKRLSYDATTGNIQTSQHVQSMIEDFWFAKGENGGSSVETLQSGMNLGEINDVEYFLKKLYKTLKLPKSRWEENVNYSAGKMGEIQREEVKFSNFINRLRSRFEKIFFDILFLQLNLKGIDKKYIKQENFNVRWVENNLFKEYKERESSSEMIDIWSKINEDVISKDRPDAAFSKEFIMKNFMKMTNEQFDKNEELKKKELADGELEEIEDTKEETKAAEKPVEETPPKDETEPEPDFIEKKEEA
jgi:hypothetical protein